MARSLVKEQVYSNIFLLCSKCVESPFIIFKFKFKKKGTEWNTKIKISESRNNPVSSEAFMFFFCEPY